MAMTTVTARVASTHPVEKYDGIRFGREAMEQLADAFNAGTVPMNFDHSALMPLEATNLTARVVDLDDGESAVDMTFDIDEEVWRSIEDRFSAAGVPGGFSFTAGALQISPPHGMKPVLVISADAAAFTDSERAKAGEVLSSLGPTQVNRLYQLSAVDLARVIIEIWPSLAIGVASSGLYDALKGLVSGRGEPTTIEIHRHRPDGSETKAIIRTEEPEVVRIALENLADEQLARSIHFDADRQVWSSVEERQPLEQLPKVIGGASGDETARKNSGDS
jgi:hypothetical protein